MRDNRDCNFDSTLELIAELKEINEKIESIKEKMVYIKEDTIVGEMVNFPSKDLDNYFRSIHRQIESIIDVEDDVIRTKKANQDSMELDFEIGEVLISTNEIRVKTSGDQRYNRILDVNGGYYSGSGEEFVIYDFIGNDYILKGLTGRSESIFLVSKHLIGVFFKKSTLPKRELIRKIEFTLNGIKREYFDHLDEVRLFEQGARERTDNSWYFGSNYEKRIISVKKSYDEIFGFSVTVYFEGSKDLDLKDIIFYFSNCFAVGFSRCKHEKDIYKYNGKISYFTKEPGGDGKHYFPKDVFEGTLKTRIVNIIGQTKLVLQPSNN